MPAGARTDEELLKASANDADAFATFYRRHATAVLAYLRRQTGDIEAAADLTADAMLSAAVHGNVAALVADLPADQRDAVLARVVEDRDYGEIARDQGCSESAVRQRVSRGLSRLRLGLHEEGR